MCRGRLTIGYFDTNNTTKVLTHVLAITLQSVFTLRTLRRKEEKGQEGFRELRAWASLPRPYWSITIKILGQL